MAEIAKNRDLEDLHRTIGSAISNWTRIEIQMHQLFSIALSFTLMQPGGGFSLGSNVPSAVLSAIDGFRGQLLMLDAALGSALENLDEEAKAIWDEWAVLRKKVNGLHWNRNALAHWTAYRTSNADGTTAEARLKPPYYASQKHEGVRATDIEHWESSFTDAADRLALLVERLASHRGLQRKFLDQVVGQIECVSPADTALIENLRQELARLSKT